MTLRPSQPVRILLVAGDDLERQKIIKILSGSDYPKVITQITSHENFVTFQKNRTLRNLFDVLLYAFTPGSTPPFEILTQIRSINLFLTVIVISSNHSIEFAVNAIKAGADDYITRSQRNLLRLPQVILSALDDHARRLDLVKPHQTEAKLRAFADEIVRKNEALAEARDKALEASRLKSEYLATMGHEIRTPMNAITGMTELLLDSSLTQEQRELIEIMRDSSQVLLTVINDILDFSKIEAGKLALEMVDFSLIDSIESVGDLFSITANQKKLDLVVYVSPQTPDYVRGDPVRLRQVLSNLTSNAIKFTETGEVEVHVDLLEESDQYVMLLFQVRDTGIGISEEGLSNLFQPFIQAETSTSRKYGGSGLGLAISKQLVQLMDGEISVNTVVGKGSTFWFTATFKKSDQDLNQSAQRSDIGFVGIKALIVDESASTRQVLNRYLELLEMNITEAASIPEGLQIMTAAMQMMEPFQVIIVGINYGGKDKSSLPPEIVQFTQAEQAHVVFLAPSGLRKLGEEAIQLGFSTYLTKPFKRNTFLETIRALISGKTVTSPGIETSVAAVKPGKNHDWQDSIQAANNHHGLILLAEDNPVNQRLISLQLQKLGYDAELVSTGKEAVQAVSQNPGRFMLVLMDLQMPDLDGIQATRMIRKNESGTNPRVPIVAISASTMEKDRKACLKAGMDDFITKPAALDDLHHVLQKWNHPEAPAAQPADVRVNPAVEKLPLLNPLILSEIRSLQGENQPDVLTEIIDIYLRDSTTYLETIRTAVESCDQALLKKGAHSLRGASGNIGAQSLAARCEELENLAVKGDFEPTQSLLSLLETEYQEVCKALAAEKVV